MKIIECVPNFSEGKDKKIIQAITDEIISKGKVNLLDVDMGKDTNRTVVTFAGEPREVINSAFYAIKKASELIDMAKHKGEHSRIGATDVCPIIPVSGVSIKECVEYSKELAERVARELNIPVYLYEESASMPERKNLSNIRQGEYEGLKEKLKDPAWKPDYATAEFNSKSGATVIGAREFLIAYNVNLNTKDKKLAHKIACIIREAGTTIKDNEGNSVKIPGKFKNLKAVGWYIEEYGIAQISMNFTNYRATPVHVVYEEIKKESDKLGLVVTGSELVGLIPKEAMIQAGRYYYERQGKNPGVPENDLIDMAVSSLGLSSIKPFIASEKIVEYVISPKGNLTDKTVSGFLNILSSDSPAPGGGSVAALCGALSAALSSMVGNLTFGKKGYEESNEIIKDLSVKSQELKDKLTCLIDKDTIAFNKVMSAYKLPKKTDEEIIRRDKEIQSAMKDAINVPLKVLEFSEALTDHALTAVENGNKNSLSDAGVALLLSRTSAYSAYYNILINLKSIVNSDESIKIKSYADKILIRIDEKVNTAEKKIIDLLLI